MGSSGTCQLCLSLLTYLYLGKDLGMQLPSGIVLEVSNGNNLTMTSRHNQIASTEYLIVQTSPRLFDKYVVCAAKH
ncbi:uncharacterized protein BDZ83DRAFT_636347 [Colletotrichum acutatum]|uniref:Uncharacterized protein n=1 Tax=Glomerella acutata TaxID=27357 RepID=A0AAD8XA13_GLOAC|nr:uncharacterized protein BDZ83DRAFT_636347 [Colletotrichum acutatum]KAK1714926.1 hypothetical protein BDZ83DRAFT_636347 [Colletotrichum acutatum]